jgi:hypothetical protein
VELVNEPSQCVNSSNTGQWHARLNHLQCEGCIARARCEVVSEKAVLGRGLVNMTTKDLRRVECPDETNRSCRLKQKVDSGLLLQLGYEKPLQIDNIRWHLINFDNFR